MKKTLLDEAEAEDLRAAGYNVMQCFTEEGIRDDMAADFLDALQASALALALSGVTDLRVDRSVLTLYSL